MCVVGYRFHSKALIGAGFCDRHPLVLCLFFVYAWLIETDIWWQCEWIEILCLVYLCVSLGTLEESRNSVKLKDMFVSQINLVCKNPKWKVWPIKVPYNILATLLSYIAFNTVVCTGWECFNGRLAVAIFWKDLMSRNGLKFPNHLGNHCLLHA